MTDNKGSFGGRPRPSGNFEMFSWYFMRISGILLIGLVLGHLAIMHLLVSVLHVDAPFVAARLANPLWRIYDLSMVILALVHGTNGARVLLNDYVHSKRSRVLAFSLLYILAFTFLVIGSLILLTYQPPVAPAGSQMSVMR